MSDRYPSDWSSRRQKVLRRDNYTCQNCGAKGGPHGNMELHVHHSVPISKGGTHQLTNLITHCDACHDAIHTNAIAPTATSSPRTHETTDVEMPGFASTLRIMGQVVIFFLFVSAAGSWGILMFIGYYIALKYIEHEYLRDSTEDNGSSTSLSSSSTSTVAGTPTTSMSHPGADQYQMTSSSTSSVGSNADSESEGNAPFEWYGDDEVPVEVVLDYVDVDLDQDTRQYIEQSVQKHRDRGDAVDAADIRWVAEASEEMNLEEDHPF